MTFAAYPTAAVPGLDLCANDPTNPPVAVLLSRGFNTGLASMQMTVANLNAPPQEGDGVSPPPQFSECNESPTAQPLSTNLPLGTAFQITESVAVSTGLQRMNTPQLTSTCL